MKWIHHRMPLFLFNSNQVNMWLDPKVSSLKALDVLKENQNEQQVILDIFIHSWAILFRLLLIKLPIFNKTVYYTQFIFSCHGIQCLLVLGLQKIKEMS